MRLCWKHIIELFIRNLNEEGEQYLTLQNQHTLFWKGSEDNLGGVGILFNKNLASNITKAAKEITDTKYMEEKLSDNT